MADQTKPLVIYHGNCQDGFTGAWACWLKHPDWEYVPAKYGEPPVPPSKIEGRSVFMIDFSYKRHVILEMARYASSIQILDHHKTAEAELVGLPANVTVKFDLTKSGASLSWDYFHPDVYTPSLVAFVEDRDNWTFKYEATKAVSAYMFSYEYTFENWNHINKEIEDYKQLFIVIDIGNALIQNQMKMVNELLQNKFRLNIGGYEVWAVNIPYTFASDAGHILGQNEPFAASFYYDGNKLKFSLRSDKASGGIDFSEIAKVYGGGGHYGAAGFELDGHLLFNNSIGVNSPEYIKKYFIRQV